MTGIAKSITKIVKGPRSAQVAIWLSSWIIFFDDCANAMIIGSIMRPVCDKFRVSREKLAYIVDSTGAPVAGICIISTWIGVELINIAQGLNAAGITNISAMDFFVQTLPFRFYNILAIFFVLALALLLREYGPMRKAEHRARTTGKTINPDSDIDTDQIEEEEESSITVGENTAISISRPTPQKPVTPNLWNALVPILVLIVSALALFYASGCSNLGNWNASPIDAFGAADASIALFQAAFLATIVALIMGFAQKIFTIHEGIGIWAHGMKSMMLVCIIMVLAWTIGSAVQYLGLQYFLSPLIANTPIPWLIPALIFILAAATSFATGTSYGTMAIYLPLCIPLAWSIASINNTLYADPIAYVILVSSAVLTGAVFGDHCSPISDSTIFSATGAGCSLLDHTTTQMWYAITIGLVTIGLYTVAGIFLSVLGTDALFPIAGICLAIGTTVCVILILILGKKVPVLPDSGKPEENR